MDMLKILSFNTCAISAADKMEAVRHLIDTSAPDVVCLQEVRAPHIGAQGYQEIMNVGPAGRGTAVLVRDGLLVSEEKRLPSGRATALKVSDVTVVNVYAPAGSQGREERAKFFLEDMAVVLADAEDKLAVVGDFNAVTRAQDTTGTASPCAILRSAVSRLKLEDAWVKLRPRESGFTFFSKVCSSRLDRLYVSQALTPGLRRAHLLPTAVSDHLALCVEIELPVHRGPAPARPRGGQWKLDPAVLSSRDFLPRLKSVWEEWEKQKSQFDDVILWWEEGKKRLRSFCAARTREVRKDDESLLTFFHDCLAELYAGRAGSQFDADAEIAYLKARVLELLGRRLVGTAARAKVPGCAGEEAGLHHVAAALRRKQQHAVETLKDEDGHEHTGQENLERYVTQHFSKLFSAPEDCAPAANSLLDGIQPTVTEEDNKALLVPATEEEVLSAVRACPRGKSPGEDGLTAELYATAWSVLGPSLVEVINAALQQHAVAPSHRKGVMILIPKVSAPSSVKDLRPVTLLDVDGKILARVFTRRLEKLQGKILHPMQVRGGSSRNMHGALCDVRDAIAVVDMANRQRGSRVEACLVALDISGAFNNIKHTFMWEVLRRHGVSQAAIKLMQSMYQDAETAVRINGQLTEPVKLLRGIRQGCVLSMLLFGMVMSPLVTALAARLRGVELPDVTGAGTPRLAVSAYVDDCVVVLEKHGDMRILEDILKTFGEESGLQVNVNKTMALPLGSWSTAAEIPFPYVDEVKILGVVFTPTVSGMLRRNWPNRIGAIRAVLADARLRAFNIQQRVQYANCYALPLLWHLAQVVPVTKQVVGEVKKAVGGFLWAGRMLRVPFDVLVRPAARGGLGLHHPLIKCEALFAGRWLSAARAADVTLAGGLLNILTALHQDGSKPSPAVQHYARLREVTSRVTVPAGLQGSDVARHIYGELLQAVAREPRVHAIRPALDWTTVWARVSSATLPTDARASWFLAVHDAVPTNERLHAIRWGDMTSPACARCGQVDTLVHRLTACGDAAANIWRWVRAKVAPLLLDPGDATPEILVAPGAPAVSNDASVAIAWTLGTVVHYAVTRSNFTWASFLAHVQKNKSIALERAPVGALTLLSGM